MWTLFQLPLAERSRQTSLPFFLLFYFSPSAHQRLQRNSKEYQQDFASALKKANKWKKTTPPFPGVHVSELANTTARSVFWWKPEITTLSPEPAQGSSQAAAVKSAVAEKETLSRLSSALCVSHSLRGRRTSPCYLQSGWGAREEKIAFCGSINSDVYPAVWTSLWTLPTAPSLSLSLSPAPPLFPTMQQSPKKPLFFFLLFFLSPLPSPSITFCCLLLKNKLFPTTPSLFPLSLFGFSLFDLAW